jgi:hypothetical protein
MALSETLKNILATMAIDPWHGVADVAGVADGGSAALAMPSSATRPLDIRCGSDVAEVADTPVPHLPHAACGHSVAEQPLARACMTEIATPATPATRVLDAQQPVRELLGPPRPKVLWCRHVWHHAYRVSRCQACGVRVPTLPAHDASEEDSAP